MIYIVRHGQTSWNVSKRLQGHKSITLTKEGCIEAKMLAEKIKNLEFEKIISSDLIRAKKTAEIINEKLQKEVIFDTRLRSIDYGNLEGRFIPHVTQDEWRILDLTPEEYCAESVESAYQRIKSLFDELIEQQENVLLVTHGGILRVVSYYIENRQIFNNEKYCQLYKDAQQVTNTALFEWNEKYTKLKPIY